jgi:hypothetical protein
VDSLIVRSNITVTLTGTNTYTNLPTDLVRLVDGKILDQYISTAVVRLMENGYINPNLLPTVSTNNNTQIYWNNRANVGIGLRNPQQKLHVHGNQCITGGRFGIGTIAPTSVLHIVDTNGPSPTVEIKQNGTVDILRIIGSNSAPIMYINGNNTVGIGKTNPNGSYSLDVAGTAYASTIRTTIFQSDTGTIDCTNQILNNLTDVISDKVTTGELTSTTQYIQSSPIYISGSTINLNAGNSSALIGLRVDQSILVSEVLTISDRRAKDNIVLTEATTNLDKVLNTPVYNFNLRNAPSTTITGFIAQDIEKEIPSAVRTITNAIPNVLQMPIYISGDRCTLGLPGHTLSSNRDIKITTPKKDIIATITDVTSDSITISSPIPSDVVPNDVLVYGEMIDDFRVIDATKLIPFVFDAVKELHSLVSQQRTCIESLTTRIDRLEKHIFPV